MLIKTIFAIINFIITIFVIFWCSSIVLILFNNCLLINLIQLIIFLMIIYFSIITIWYLLFSKIAFIKKILVFVAVCLFFYLGWDLPAIKIANSIDSCLNNSGRWNYKKNICEYN